MSPRRVDREETGPKPPGCLRIVSWNCAGALHRKWRWLADLQPDVAVVQEACRPERLPASICEGSSPTRSEWIGRLDHKGLAVFGFGEWEVRRRADADDRLEWILPVEVSGPLDFLLVGVWAMNHRANQPVPEGLPRSQPAAAAEVYDFDANRDRLVVAGDFNNAPQWDTPQRPTFARLVDRYAQADLCSAYHRLTGEPFGRETRPTHWWRNRTVDGPRYHIDYMFIPAAWESAAAMSVGDHRQWVELAGSDHAALVLDLDLARISEKSEGGRSRRAGTLRRP